MSHTRSDPSRLLLSADSVTTAPTATLNTVLIGGNTNTEPFYVQAFVGTGSASLKVSAAGYIDATIPVTFMPTSVSFGYYQGFAPRLLVQSGQQTGYVSLSGTLRPGASTVVAIQSSDPSILAIDTPQLAFVGGSSQLPFLFRALAPGSATVSLVVPDGYAAGLVTSVPMTVAAPGLGFSSSTATVVAQDSQVGIDLTGELNFPPGLPLTITSSDPSKLLIGDTQSSTGQGTITISAQGGLYQPVYLNGLVAGGTVTVSVSAPGYIPGSLQVSLAPSAAVFQNTSLSISANQSSQVYVQFVQLNPATLAPANSVNPRPGVNLTVSIKSSDSTIVQVPVTSVTLNSNVTATVMLKAIAPGTAIISLGTLPNGTTPASGSQLVVNVTH